ncbi:slit homolog 2 protein-like [Mytilus trossulus]|uniref:slit homolog 2 protein-like n=1 Tax=Mytilus trossulus TaxID=6551 RepID=UPI00300471C4
MMMLSVRILVVFLLLPLLSSATQQWTDGVCGICICSKQQGNYEMEYVVNCTRKDIKTLPDNLPRNIHRLDLSFNSLGSSSLQNLELYGDDLISLSLESNNVTIINTDILSSLRHLEELDLTGNVLDYIDDRLFIALNLRKLSGISAKMFHRSAFWKLVSLEDLSVIFEQEMIDENIFKNLQVFHLDVTFRYAKEIPVSLFQFGTNTLTRLTIDGPLLSSLPNGIFDGLTVLKTLIIRGGNIRWLSNSLFYRPSATSMPLHLNKISIIGVKSIPRDLFKGQLSLKFAILQNIEDIPPLDLPVQLDNLDMSGSNVFRVSPDVFMKLTNLRELNLSNSSLSSLESESFIGLSSLSDLDLSRNKILTLPEKIFEACRYTLDFLDLSYNQIPRIQQFYFNMLKSLRVLDLSHNKIQSIHAKAFEKLNMLTDLKCRGNMISTLPDTLFSNILSIQVIELGKNNISRIASTLFDNLYQLSSLNLESNPLHCDCSVKLIRMTYRYLQIQGVCNTPKEYHEYQLSKLERDESCYIIEEESSSVGLFSSIHDTKYVHQINFEQTIIPTQAMTSTTSKKVDVLASKTSNDSLSGISNNIEHNDVIEIEPTSVYVNRSMLAEQQSTIWHSTGFIVLYVCVGILGTVIIITTAIGCRNVCKDLRRRGTYILPPP